MRNLAFCRRLAVGAAVLLLGVLGCSVSAESAEVEVTVVHVQAAQQEPTATDVILSKGQRVQIKARGEWCAGGPPGGPGCGGPEGINKPQPAELPLIRSDLKFGTLLGRIGDGPWFKIGKGGNVRANRSGELFLIFNERSNGCCWGDNSGSVRVRIKPLPNRGPKVS